MVRKFFGLFAILLALPLFFSACGDDVSGETLVGRYDEDNKKFSPAKIAGTVAYSSCFKPESVLVIPLNYDLDPVDTIRIQLENNNGRFSTDMMDLESPYVKIVSILVSADSSRKQEFPQYANVARQWGEYQTLPQSIAFDRMTDLVKKDGFSLNEAREIAVQELISEFGGKKNDLEDIFAHTQSWFPLYIFARCFVNDSVFFSDYLDIAERFRERHGMDEVVRYRFADEALPYVKFSPNTGLFLDLPGCVSYLNFSLVYSAYGLTDASQKEGTIKTVASKQSAYYGHNFVYDSYVDARHYVNYFWRFVEPLEDTLGICTREKKEMQKHNGKFYSCDWDSSAWRLREDADVVLDYAFGDCWRNGSSLGMVRIYKDSVFRCSLEETYGWHPYEIKLDPADSSYAAEVDGLANEEFGTCRTTGINNGKKEILNDSIFVRCQSNRWTLIPYEYYWMPNCNSEQHEKIGQVPDGRYFKCMRDGTLQEVTLLDYEGVKCDTSVHNQFVLKDDAYFRCDARCDSCDTGKWFLVTGADSIPPVWNNDVCGYKQANLLKKYDDVYYLCDGTRWNVAPDSLITAPVKDGYICQDSLFNKDHKSGGVYYICRNNYKWSLADSASAVSFTYRDKYGPCTSMIGTSMKWDENLGSYLGCGKNYNGEYLWVNYSFDSLYGLPENIKSEDVTSGKFTGVNGYAFGNENANYEFLVYNNSKLVLDRMEIDGVWYETYYYNGRLFLHAPIGTNITNINQVGDGSESYETFREDWTKKISDIVANDSGFRKVNYVRFVNSSSTSYTNWEKAKDFCPAGFHIPAPEEFMTPGFLRYETINPNLRNDSPIEVWYEVDGCYNRPNVYCSSTSVIRYYDIFWTSEEKDEGTQLCYEYGEKKGTVFEQVASQIIECPKDLFPMVQVICVQNQ